MTFQEARELIRCDELTALRKPVQWADLGCGQGLFTHALASWLPAGSTVYAIDKERGFDPAIASVPDVTITFRQNDFITSTLGLPPLDGILMANALHYVQDKIGFMEKMIAACQGDPCFLIVEYDITEPVPRWVPYPVPFNALQTLFAGAGFTALRKLGERPSLYGRGNMYSAIIRKEQNN